MLGTINPLIIGINAEISGVIRYIVNLEKMNVILLQRTNQGILLVHH